MSRGRGRSQKTIDLLDATKHILKEIQPASVRAVCYRLFVAGLIPSMAKTETNRVGSILTRAREDGEIPWAWIVDETREAEMVSTWSGPEELFRSCVRQYRRDLWSQQSEWVEIWSEKGTVRGTLAPLINEYGVTFRVMHGFASATALNDVAEMTRGAPKHLTVLYVGDRDPSGMHMSEIDLPSRLARYGADGSDISIQRVAIDHEDTLESAGLPWFPAADKAGDRRHRWYVQKYGTRCWEVDALSPVVLRDRVEVEILKRINLAAWERAIHIENAERESMRAYLAGYPSISRQASK